MHSDEFDLPDPPDVHPVRGPRAWRWLIIGGVLIAIAFAAFRIPITAFYAYLPGPVKDVERLVDVTGKETYSSEGELFLTTVSVDISVTFAEWVKDSFDPTAAVVQREQVTGGQSFETLERDQLKAMDESKQHAEEVALAALGLAEPTSDGVRITQFVADSPASKILEVGDVITKVDGEPVTTSCQVGSTVGPHDPGDTISITVRRNKKVKTFDLETIPDPEDPSGAIIGVGLTDINYRFDPGLTVTFKTGEIAGPSAGLMFTLALYDRLTPEDLTSGRKIAGTGTIACDGQVGPIGGVEQKVAGAEAEGAEIFLAPAANFAAAEAVADDIQVVRVSTFQDALTFLQALQ
jgi:PDZ domain-containing protein